MGDEEWEKVRMRTTAKEKRRRGREKRGKKFKKKTIGWTKTGE